MGVELELAIAHLAGRQHGLVTRAQLLSLGMSARAIEGRLRGRRMRAVHRGVYRTGGVETPREREMAAVLAAGHGAVVSHRSAAWLHGLMVRPPDTHPVEVVVPGRQRVRRPGILARRVRWPPSATAVLADGIPATPVARTLVDLAGVLDAASLERAVARAERQGLAAREDLVAMIGEAQGRPGVRLLRSVAGGMGDLALTRSEAEVRFLQLVRDARLPTPEVNAVLLGYEVDFLWRARRMAVEVDGYRFHASRHQFRRDRRRDSRLAAAGIQVIRLSWEQIVEEPLATAAELAQALALASRPRTGPADPSETG